MSLDRPLSDAELRAEANRRAASSPEPSAPTLNGVALGPNSPMRGAGKPRKQREDREHPIQSEVIVWADDPATLPAYPELKALFAIPNASGSGGKRTKLHRQLEGARRQAEGMRAGMPDLCLPVARVIVSPTGRASVSGALYVEMKDESGTVRQSQRERIAMLRAAGNRVEVAMSADSAKAIIAQYLGLPKP